MYFLLRHWGASRLAAFFAGFVYALCPIRYLSMIVALQLVAMAYLPLTLLFLDRTMAHGRVRDVLLAGTFLCLQLLCSFYVAYISAIAVAVYVAIALWFGRVVKARATATALFFGVGVFAVSAIPYLVLDAGGRISSHSDAGLSAVSAGLWSSYATRPHFGRFVSHSTYLGIVPSLLFLASLACFRSRRVMMPVVAMLGVSLVMYILALGPHAKVGEFMIPLPYKWMQILVPGFSAMRVPLRFVFGLMFGFSALAGFGLDWLLEGLAVRSLGKFRVLSVAGLVALTSLDYGHFRYSPVLLRLRAMDLFRPYTGR